MVHFQRSALPDQRIPSTHIAPNDSEKNRNARQEPGGFFALLRLVLSPFVQKPGSVEIPPKPRGPFPREWSQTAVFPSVRRSASLRVCVWLHCQGLPPPSLFPLPPLELCGSGTPFWPGVNFLISTTGSGRRTPREGALAEGTPWKLPVSVQAACSLART